jgi:hypothetical protein
MGATNPAYPFEELGFIPDFYLGSYCSIFRFLCGILWTIALFVLLRLTTPGYFLGTLKTLHIVNVYLKYLILGNIFSSDMRNVVCLQKKEESHLMQVFFSCHENENSMSLE